MGRSKDVALVDRNQRIVEMVAEGYSYQIVADNFGISKQRVAQINQEFQETVTDDAYRDLQRTRLEGAEEVLWKLIRGKGKLVISPGGKIVCEYNPDGTVDFSRPVYDEYAKIDAIMAYTKIAERISRSYGLDRFKQKEHDQSEEMTAFLAEVERMAAENTELRAKLEALSPPVLEAEIVEEAHASVIIS